MASHAPEKGSVVNWHSLDVEPALQEADTTPEGLSVEEAGRRLERFGPNRLRPAQRRGPLVRFLLQFHNILIYILLIAAVVTAVLEHWIDSGVILAVVIVNALIGFIQEGKAEKALEAISRMLSLDATVIRQGKRQSIPAEQIVPGDLVVLRAGDKVPADLRLIETRELRADEAMLTGESIPVDKQIDPLPAETGMADRSCMAFSGTLVATGRGTGVAIATGDRTEIGRISEMVSQTEELTTPLIRQMNRFGRVLAIVVVLFAAITFALGFFLRGADWAEMFLAAVALAVAVIPEGLPAIMSIILAIGVRRMANRSAIIRRLPAVDTLGALTVICSDKTGTLTRNEMTVTRVVTARGTCEVTGVGYAPDGEIRRQGEPADLSEESPVAELIRGGLLCNDSELHHDQGRWTPAGDPMESALITLAIKAGLDPDRDRARWRALDTIPFESRNRFMATLHPVPDRPGQRILYVKGAPERVLAMCRHQRRNGQDESLDEAHWREQVEALASQGLRLLAVATRLGDPQEDQLDFEGVQHDLVLLGLLGIIDPPREEAIRAVEQCHDAGIRVVMITGDHASTARAIGGQLRIGDGGQALTGADLESMNGQALGEAARNVDVFARVSPEHKLRLVEAIQAQGHVVAMTGDGVNDAPALKRADVGIAMGIKGTEVSKEAAEVVLTDDNFASIAHAVEEGRTVYDNLRKAILFVLPTNGGEGLTIFLAILLGITLPLTPVQVLWINMITSVTLGLALAFEPPEADVMRRPPRSPRAGLLSPYFLWRITLVSAILCAVTFGLFLWMRQQGVSLEYARTVAVNALVMAEAFYLLSARFIYAPVLSRRGLLGSRPVLIAIGLVVLFQMPFTYLPQMQRLFGTEAIRPSAWVLLVLGASSALFLVELEKWIAKRLSGDTPGMGEHRT
jgi:magnesium-transporting ATPase (P-type)